LPVNFTKETSLSKLYRNLDKINLKKISDVYLNQLARIYLKTRLIKEYDLVFASGSVDASRHNRNSRIIALNHFDYDNYLIGKNKATRIIDYEYCVFLDDNIVYDTDYKIFNRKTIDPGSYFKSMCNLFDQIEKVLKIKVIVAAHPKAQYEDTEFGNREIIKGRTNELVKDCSFAIAHYSTSISFAVLYSKPLVFVYTGEMKKMFYFKNIRHYASILNAPIFNVDAIQGEKELEVGLPDKARYNDYKYKYLVSQPTEDILSADVFIQTMTDLSNHTQIMKS